MVLLKTSINSWYLEETLERSEASASFVQLAWMPKEQRQSSKLLRSKSFDSYKNAVTPMIVILDHSDIDMEVSNTNMKSMESNDCREVSRDNRNVNGMLATIWEGARFSYKDEQKFINLFV